MNIPFCMGVGGSFDVVVESSSMLLGSESRSRMGLSVKQEPRRMFRRNA